MGRRLAQVEQPLEFLFRAFGEQGDAQGSAGEMAGPLAAFGCE